ncbi:MAG: hypothetical protein ACKVPX_08000 [Myxococcaceae bacterium]
MSASFSLMVLMLSATGSASKATLKVPPQDDAERPVPLAISAYPQDGNLALRVEFDKAPWGNDCGQRCANTTVFIDLDAGENTGLQLTDQAEAGADLAITIQGVRDYREESALPGLRIRSRHFETAAGAVDSGEPLQDLDLRRDPDRVSYTGKSVKILIDLSQRAVPAGKAMRIVYHPPGGQSVTAQVPGFLAGEVRHRARLKKKKR